MCSEYWDSIVNSFLQISNSSYESGHRLPPFPPQLMILPLHRQTGYTRTHQHSFLTDVINPLLNYHQQWYQYPKVMSMWNTKKASLYLKGFLNELSWVPKVSIGGNTLQTSLRTGAGGQGKGLLFLRLALPGYGMWFPVFKYEILPKKWDRGWEVQTQHCRKIQADLREVK